MIGPGLPGDTSPGYTNQTETLIRIREDRYGDRHIEIQTITEHTEYRPHLSPDGSPENTIPIFVDKITTETQMVVPDDLATAIMHIFDVYGTRIALESTVISTTRSIG